MSTFDSPRPLVTVGHPTVEWEPGVPHTVREALILTCTEHGELTDWLTLNDRHLLQRRARRHAEEHHQGDVDADGWAR